LNTLLTTSTKYSAAIIKRGGVVAFPTETVYGLGADIFNATAIKKIFQAKGRPSDNPLIAHIGKLEQIEQLVTEITPSARKFIDEFFPSPLTIILPKSDRVPLIATAGLETIGVRMPNSDLARRFLNECQTPLVAPSANISGKPSPTNWLAVYDDLNGKIDGILQGDISAIGLESTVVDCTGEIPLILRSGAITLEDLQEVVPETQNYRLKKDEQPKSPGLKHRHYSPNATVILVQSAEFGDESLENTAFIGLSDVEPEFGYVKICGSVEEYAQSVFDFFRRSDSKGIKIIYCESVPEQGIGVALMDRIRRAAEG
jgi:L-threonylcarbamoyladenylate synthase